MCRENKNPTYQMGNMRIVTDVCLLGVAWDASWGSLGASWRLLEPSWSHLVDFGAIVPRFLALLDRLGASWGPLGPSWGLLGPEQFKRDRFPGSGVHAASPGRFGNLGSAPLKDPQD